MTRKEREIINPDTRISFKENNAKKNNQTKSSNLKVRVVFNIPKMSSHSGFSFPFYNTFLTMETDEMQGDTHSLTNRRMDGTVC